VPMPVRQLGGHVLVGLYEPVAGRGFPASQWEWVPMSYKAEEKTTPVASHVLETERSLSTPPCTTTGPNVGCNRQCSGRKGKPVLLLSVASQPSVVSPSKEPAPQPSVASPTLEPCHFSVVAAPTSAT
jgi:hypothetical protein